MSQILSSDAQKEKTAQGSQKAWHLKKNLPVANLSPSPSRTQSGRWQQEAGEGPGGTQAPQWSCDYRDLSLPPPAPTLIKSFFPLLESPRALSARDGATAGSCRQPHERGVGRKEGGCDWGLATLQSLAGGALIQRMDRELLNDRPP